MSDLETIRQIAARCVQTGRAFAQRPRGTINELFEATGYAGAPARVGLEAFRQALLKEPDCVEGWLLYSSDKRSIDAWYFMETEDGQFEVGFCGEQETRDRKTYRDRIEACAQFLVVEFAHWASRHSRSRPP